MLAVFSLTIFTSALLLFLIQPMFARMLVPLLGGAPAIWNTALVFYQATLLAGYAYAHLSIRWLGVRRQSLLHLCLMLGAILSLPIGLPAGWQPPAQSNPVPWLLGLLAMAVGMPLFVVSATSPLLQRWFSATRHRHASDPYFLYAASNLGSMAALLAYPILVEPALKLQLQGWCWMIGYAVLIAMIAACAALVYRFPDTVFTPHAGKVAEKRAGKLEVALHKGFSEVTPAVASVPVRLRWVLLAFVPSSLMMSVTTHLTTDIAAVPLLWVIPLSIYLLTFILVFARRPLLPHGRIVIAMPFTSLPLVVMLAAGVSDPMWLVMPLHLIAFFNISMVCHGELARMRPSALDLTAFYLYLSVGGVLGGAFNALLAPLLFDSIAEYPIILTSAFLLLPRMRRHGRPGGELEIQSPLRNRILDFVLPALLGLTAVVLIKRIQSVNPSPGQLSAAIAFSLPVLVSASFVRRPLRLALSVGAILAAGSSYEGSQGQVLFAERSFFGVTRVARDPSGQFNQILQGSTLHGSQWITPALRRRPVAYYDSSGPLGQFFEAFRDPGRLKNIAIVGLGSGGICCYAQPGQDWTYYEIDPAVERLARDSRFFTYLQDCEAPVRVLLGDGRLSLAAAPDGAYDLILMDAYNSDAIPVHLLTREALQLYRRKLSPAGVMVFHISNRYLDLEPVLANLAREAGFSARTQHDTSGAKSGSPIGRIASKYLIIASRASDLGSLESDPRWLPSRTQENLGTWTDDYSSIVKILKWRRGN